MDNFIILLGRLLLAHMFLLSGITKIGSYTATAAYMDAMGVPGALLPLVILLEVLGGLLLIAGYRVKWASYALAGFSLFAALIFHSNFIDQIQMIMFMKNLTIVGGLLILSVHGAGKLSLDEKLRRS